MSVAKSRKRCPHCRKMLEVGEECTVTDDRFTIAGNIWGKGDAFQRGAFHLWHPACKIEHDRIVAENEIASQNEHRAEIENIRAFARTMENAK